MAYMTEKEYEEGGWQAITDENGHWCLYREVGKARFWLHPEDQRKRFVKTACYNGWQFSYQPDGIRNGGSPVSDAIEGVYGKDDNGIKRIELQNLKVAKIVADWAAAVYC